MTISNVLASALEKSIGFHNLLEENILLQNSVIGKIDTGYIIGSSVVMRKVYRTIEKVAPTNSPVLLLGETGTGKGMLARLLHSKSARKDGPFIPINCGAIPDTLLESELFGHRKGSFTGAVNDKKGLLEEAEKGTVFLDEIANTSPSFQAKLLNALEEKRIRRIGDTTMRSTDVRFLFATNKNLDVEIKKERFREDLYYRINVVNIHVPPLRKRQKDIPLLAHYFLEKFSREVNKGIKDFTPESLKKMKDYHWPGNVRELQNLIERAVVLADGETLTDCDLGLTHRYNDIFVSLTDMKKEAILEALRRTDWRIGDAARQLHISRKTIQRYIKKYALKK
jgi:transcriptional regulator with PAS, ATPase and Fis domain